MADARLTRPADCSGERSVSRRALVSRAGVFLAGFSAAAAGLGRPTPASAASGDPLVAGGLQTTGGTVDVTSAAPKPGQVLTAEGPASAVWADPPAPAVPMSGSLRTLRPRGGDAVLIDPNRANGFTVVLPQASLGGVSQTTILPVAGAPTTGRLWSRLLQFRQPASGPAVDPRLAPELLGARPEWGSGGASSVDVVGVVSSDGRSWMITGSASVPPTVAKSILSSLTGAPAASADPLGLPTPILIWSAADMLAGTKDGARFGPGTTIGHDFSGSGNALIVNAGERMTFRRGPLHGAAPVPRALGGFPFLYASAAKTGMGCSFVGGAVEDWTVVVSFLPADLDQGPVFASQPVFQTRAAGKVPSVRVGVEGASAASTWDGTSSNDVKWPGDTFRSPRGGPVPTVVGWSVTAGTVAAPLLVAGTPRTPLAPGAARTTTRAPASVAGIDLPSSYAYCGLAVFAAALTPVQVEQAALRLGFVAFGETV